MGEQSSVERWNPVGWYMYVNPFENRNEKLNMYKGHVSLSFSFLSPDSDLKDVLERESIYEGFNDLNESHLCHSINYIANESDKFLSNNINAVNLFNYRQTEEINASGKYKAARAKRISGKKVKPYQPRKTPSKVDDSDDDDDDIIDKKRNKRFQKLVNTHIIVDNDDEENAEEDAESVINEEIITEN